MNGYDLASRPPWAVLLPSALQHVGIGAVTLVFPLLVADAAGVDAATREAYVDLAMLALGLATLLQCWGRHGIGSGFLLPSVFTAIYLPPSLAAAAAGGLGAVAGLAIVAGLTEAALSRLVRPLRALLPTEVMGLVVLLIGIILGLLGLRLMLGLAPGEGPAPQGPAGWGVALATLAATVAATVWGGPRLRAVAVLAGLGLGTALHLALGLGLGEAAIAEGTALGQALVPIVWPLAAPSLDPVLVPGAMVGALACLVRVSGDVVASERLNDPDWKRPDFRAIERGVLADGLGCALAGAIGVMGTNSYSASVGLAAATGVRARRVGLAAGWLWVALALLPGTAALLLSVPRGVMGAALFYSACFIVASGIGIVATRLLDPRRILVIGAALVLGLSYDAAPQLYAMMPPALQGVVTSSLVVAMAAALLLGAVLRLGSTRRAAFRWDPRDGLPTLAGFAAAEAAAAGARVEAGGRAGDLLEEFAAAIPLLLPAGETVGVELAFDELHLDITLRWRGEKLPPAGAVPEGAGTDDPRLVLALASALLRRHADRLAAETLAGGVQVLRARIEQ